MRFTKMHGIGNDYIYVNAFEETVAHPEKLAPLISDRHTGIGGDGLILVAPPTLTGQAAGAAVRMRMFNADGSEAEMCGNGVRCVAKFAYERGLAHQNPMKIETGRGVLTLQLAVNPAGLVDQVTVNMGQPILELADIPVNAEWVAKTARHHEYQIIPAPEKSVKTSGGSSTLSHGIPATFVSMGNPHAVIFSPNVAKVDLEKIGPALEHHHAFPRRINVHFVQIESRTEVIMRTWERGSGITLACGTGAAAVCVAGALMDKTERKILAHLPGGDLTLEWREADNCVYLTGPATEVFTGEWKGPV